VKNFGLSAKNFGLSMKNIGLSFYFSTRTAQCQYV
jgi:hypothetical protein